MGIYLHFLVIILLFCSYVSTTPPPQVKPQNNLKTKNLIRKLPGQPSGINFRQYSGYISVDPAKTLFYYFVESPLNFSTKPLVLWLNGGPGCSSFGSAFLELGPFRVKRDGKKLMLNPYSWHNVANMLFLDSPAGVGYSFGNETIIANQTGDISTTKDTYIFLINWLERFPEYKVRDFYITGESYAGHYAPELAYSILHYNENGSYPMKINLKGIAIGSPWIDNEINWTGLYENLWRRDMCSNEAHAEIFQSCNFSEFVVSKLGKDCDRAIDKVAKETGNIQLFSIYAPICNISMFSDVIESVDVYDPCSEIYLDNYTARRKVQEALHIRPTIWSQCRKFDVWQDSPDTILPIIKWLSTKNIRMWFFSGDFDGYVPPLSTKTAIETLNLPIRTQWQAWYCNNKVAGYVVEYEGLTMLTVREAGHQVPAYQPQRALMLFSSFLQGTLPPTSP